MKKQFVPSKTGNLYYKEEDSNIILMLKYEAGGLLRIDMFDTITKKSKKGEKFYYSVDHADTGIEEHMKWARKNLNRISPLAKEEGRVVVEAKVINVFYQQNPCFDGKRECIFTNKHGLKEEYSDDGFYVINLEIGDEKASCATSSDSFAKKFMQNLLKDQSFKLRVSFGTNKYGLKVSRPTFI